MRKTMEELRKEVQEYKSPFPKFDGEEGFVDPDYMGK